MILCRFFIYFHVYAHVTKANKSLWLNIAFCGRWEHGSCDLFTAPAVIKMVPTASQGNNNDGVAATEKFAFVWDWRAAHFSHCYTIPDLVWATLDGRNQLKNPRWMRATFEVCPTGHRMNGPLSLAMECRRLHSDNVPEFAANPLAKCGATCGSTRRHL